MEMRLLLLKQKGHLQGMIQWDVILFGLIIVTLHAPLNFQT